MLPDPDLEQALLDPSSVFSSPEAVLSATTFTENEKIEILRRWAYDARELAVAEEEGMLGGGPSLLSSIQLALAELGIELDLEHTTPTKQSGD